MVETDGPLAPERAAEYIRQAADGLAHAHQHNMVHGDIQPIDSSNEVGFSVVAATAGDDQIITVPYVACLDSNNPVSLEDLVSTNGLVAHASDPALADQVIVMTESGGNLYYYYYWLKAGDGWTAITTEVKHPDGSTSSVTPPAASAFDIARGLGFWLKRVASSSSDIYVKGEISSSNPSTSIAEGLNLIGYGTAAALELNSASISWTGAYGGTGNTATSDKIIIINSDGTMQNYYYFTCPAGWSAAYQALDGKWIDESYVEATATVSAGQGFWYLRRGTGSFNFQPDGS
jgi:serine/threonine protein kinase